MRARLSSLLAVPRARTTSTGSISPPRSTLVEPAQEPVTRLLRSLRDPATVQALGLKGLHLLDDRGDPARVIYSFTLYEKTAGAQPRAGADRQLRPAVRHQRGGAPRPRLLGQAPHAHHLPRGRRRAARAARAARARRAPRHRGAPARSAHRLGRRVSRPSSRQGAPAHAGRRDGAPVLGEPREEFSTGGGLQAFHNFEPEDDARIMSVRDAFRHSVNLVFIRLMRDVVRYHLYREPESLGRILEDPARSATARRTSRASPTARAASSSASFYRKYQGKTPAEALELLVERRPPDPAAARDDPALGEPRGERRGPARAALRAPARRRPGRRGGRGAPHEVRARRVLAHGSRVHRAGASARAVARSTTCATHPGASLDGHAAARAPPSGRRSTAGSSRPRGATRRTSASRTCSSSAPSSRSSAAGSASAIPSRRSRRRSRAPIGASGDRPAALAELMGIIVNDGVRHPTVDRGSDRVRPGHAVRDAVEPRGVPAGEQVMAPDDRGGRPRSRSPRW